MSTYVRCLSRLALLVVGLALFSSGMYLLSQQYDDSLLMVLPYLLAVPGAIFMVSGGAWSWWTSMMIRIKKQRRAFQRQVHIFTVERVSSLPPSYESSQSSPLSAPPLYSPQSQSEELLDICVIPSGLAPPVYSQDRSEAPDGSWESPPHYSQEERPIPPYYSQKEKPIPPHYSQERGPIPPHYSQEEGPIPPHYNQEERPIPPQDPSPAP